MMDIKKTRLGKGVQSVLGKFFSLLPLTPVQITASSLLLAAAGFASALLSMPTHSLIFFTLSGAADAIDGAVARAKRAVSARGAYIDGICDRLVEFLLVLSLLALPLPALTVQLPPNLPAPAQLLPFLHPFAVPSQLSLLLILFFGSAMSSFATAYAEHRHVADSRKISRQPGALPRAERVILLLAALALLPFYPVASSAILLLGAALCIITFAQRFAYFAGE